jgi:hypothetical protein
LLKWDKNLLNRWSDISPTANTQRFNSISGLEWFWLVFSTGGHGGCLFAADLGWFSFNQPLVHVFGCLQRRWKLLFLSCYVFLNGGGGMPADPAVVMMVGSLVLDFGLVRLLR